MATNVNHDQVLDGIVRLGATLLPATGQPTTATKPLRECRRYMGELQAKDGLRRGLSGRSPALLVAFAGEKTLRTTIGRRVDRVEATYLAIGCTDSHRDKNDRELIFAVLKLALLAIGARRMGLSINPMRYQGTVPLVEEDGLLAYALRFTTRYRVDYTIDPGPDRLLSLDGTVYGGDINNPDISVPIVETFP